MARIYREAGRVIDLMEARGCGLRTALYHDGGADTPNPLLPKICALVCRTLERKEDLQARLSGSGLCASASSEDQTEGEGSFSPSLREAKGKGGGPEERDEDELKGCTSLDRTSRYTTTHNNQRQRAKGIFLVMAYDLLYGRGRILGGGRWRRLLLTHLKGADERSSSNEAGQGQNATGPWRGRQEAAGSVQMRAGGRSSSTCSRTSCREGSEEEEGRRTPVARKREREKDSARLDIFEPYDSLPRYLRVSLSRSPVAEVLADLNEYFVSTGMLAPSSCSPAHPCGYPPLSPRANEDPSSVCSQRQGTLSPSLPSSLPPSPSSSPSSASPHLRASSSLPAKPVEGLGLSSSWTLPSSASWVVSRDPLLPSCGLRAPSKAAQLLIHHPLVKEGVVVLQDRASSLAALSADIQPRDCVLDACASPGSKTLHVLDLLHGQGHLIALERDVARAAVLIRRLLIQGNLDGPFSAPTCSSSSRLGSRSDSVSPPGDSSDYRGRRRSGKTDDRTDRHPRQTRSGDVYRVYARKASEQPLYFTSRDLAQSLSRCSPSPVNSSAPSIGPGPSGVSSFPASSCPCLASCRGTFSPRPCSSPGHPLLLVEVRVADFLQLSGSEAPFCFVEKLLLDPSCSGSGLPLHALEARGVAEHLPLLSTASVHRQDDKAPVSRSSTRSGSAPDADQSLDHSADSTTSSFDADHLRSYDDSGYHATPALGVMSRLSPEMSSLRRVQQLGAFQRRLLLHALTNFPSLRVCCYSTCSSYVEENEGVVAYALEEIRRTQRSASRDQRKRALWDDETDGSDRQEVAEGKPTAGPRTQKIGHRATSGEATCAGEKEMETEEVQERDREPSEKRENDHRGSHGGEEAGWKSEIEGSEPDGITSEWKVTRGQQVDDRWFPSEELMACLRAKLLEEQHGRDSTGVDSLSRRGAAAGLEMMKTRTCKKPSEPKVTDTEALFERWKRSLFSYGSTCVRSSPATHSCRGFFLARLERRTTQECREETGEGKPAEPTKHHCRATKHKRPSVRTSDPAGVGFDRASSTAGSLRCRVEISTVSKTGKRSLGETEDAGRTCLSEAPDRRLRGTGDRLVSLSEKKKRRKTRELDWQPKQDPANPLCRGKGPTEAAEEPHRPAHARGQTVVGNELGTRAWAAENSPDALEGKESKKRQLQRKERMPTSKANRHKGAGPAGAVVCKRKKKLRSHAWNKSLKRGIVVT